MEGRRAHVYGKSCAYTCAGQWCESCQRTVQHEQLTRSRTQYWARNTGTASATASTPGPFVATERPLITRRVRRACPVRACANSDSRSTPSSRGAGRRAASRATPAVAVTRTCCRPARCKREQSVRRAQELATKPAQASYKLVRQTSRQALGWHREDEARVQRENESYDRTGGQQRATCERANLAGKLLLPRVSWCVSWL
jgi:hypothetical protein